MAQNPKFNEIETVVKRNNHHIGVLFTFDLNTGQYKALSYGISKELCAIGQQAMDEFVKAINDKHIVIPY